MVGGSGEAGYSSGSATGDSSYDSGGGSVSTAPGVSTYGGSGSNAGSSNNSQAYTGTNSASAGGGYADGYSGQGATPAQAAGAAATAAEAGNYSLASSITATTDPALSAEYAAKAEASSASVALGGLPANTFPTGTPEWWSFEIAARETAATTNTAETPISKSAPGYYDYYAPTYVVGTAQWYGQIAEAQQYNPTSATANTLITKSTPGYYDYVAPQYAVGTPQWSAEVAEAQMWNPMSSLALTPFNSEGFVHNETELFVPEDYVPFASPMAEYNTIQFYDPDGIGLPLPFVSISPLTGETKSSTDTKKSADKNAPTFNLPGPMGMTVTSIERVDNTPTFNLPGPMGTTVTSINAFIGSGNLPDEPKTAPLGIGGSLGGEAWYLIPGAMYGAANIYSKAVNDIAESGYESVSASPLPMALKGYANAEIGFVSAVAQLPGFVISLPYATAWTLANPAGVPGKALEIGTEMVASVWEREMKSPGSALGTVAGMYVGGKALDVGVGKLPTTGVGFGDLNPVKGVSEIYFEGKPNEVSYRGVAVRSPTAIVSNIAEKLGYGKGVEPWEGDIPVIGKLSRPEGSFFSDWSVGTPKSLVEDVFNPERLTGNEHTNPIFEKDPYPVGNNMISGIPVVKEGLRTMGKPGSLELFGAQIELLKETKNIDTSFVRNPAEVLDTMGGMKPGMGQAMLDVLKPYEHKIGGSFAAAVQSKSFPMPKDIDMYLPVEAQAPILKSMAEIVQKAYPNDKLVITDGGKLITIPSVNRGIAFDVHELPKVGSMQDRYAIRNLKPTNIEGNYFQSIREQAQRKLTATAMLKNEEGVWSITAQQWRGKDIADTSNSFNNYLEGKKSSTSISDQLTVARTEANIKVFEDVFNQKDYLKKDASSTKDPFKEYKARAADITTPPYKEQYTYNAKSDVWSRYSTKVPTSTVLGIDIPGMSVERYAISKPEIVRPETSYVERAATALGVTSMSNVSAPLYGSSETSPSAKSSHTYIPSGTQSSYPQESKQQPYQSVSRGDTHTITPQVYGYVSSIPAEAPITTPYNQSGIPYDQPGTPSTPPTYTPVTPLRSPPSNPYGGGSSRGFGGSVEYMIPPTEKKIFAKKEEDLHHPIKNRKQKGKRFGEVFSFDTYKGMKIPERLYEKDYKSVGSINKRKGIRFNETFSLDMVNSSTATRLPTPSNTGRLKRTKTQKIESSWNTYKRRVKK